MSSNFENQILQIKQTVLQKYDILFEKIVKYETICFDNIINALIKTAFIYDQSLSDKISSISHDYFSSLQNQACAHKFNNSFIQNIRQQITAIYNKSDNEKNNCSTKINCLIFGNIVNHLTPGYLNVLSEKIGAQLLSLCFRTVSFHTVSLIINSIEDQFAYDILDKLCQNKAPSQGDLDNAMRQIIAITNQAISDGLIKLPYDDKDNYFKEFIITDDKLASDGNTGSKSGDIPTVSKQQYEKMTLSQRADFFRDKMLEKYSLTEDLNLFKKRIDLALHFASTLHNKIHNNKQNLIGAIDSYFYYPDESSNEDNKFNGIDPIVQSIMLDIIMKNKKSDVDTLFDNIEWESLSFMTDLDYKLDYSLLESTVSQKYQDLAALKLMYVQKVRFFLDQIEQLFAYILQLHADSKKNNNSDEFELEVLQTLDNCFDNDIMILSSENQIPHITFLGRIFNEVNSQNDFGDCFLNALNESSAFLGSLYVTTPLLLFHLFTVPYTQFQNVIRYIPIKHLLLLLKKYPKCCTNYVYSCYSPNGVRRLEEDAECLSPVSQGYTNYIEDKSLKVIINKNKNLFNR